MFVKKSQQGYIEVLPGIQRKTLVFGKHTLMTEFTLAKGCRLPLHSHSQEQTGYLVAGHMILTIGNEETDIQPGDSWMVPGNIKHGAEVVEDSIAIEVFSPLREDYL